MLSALSDAAVEEITFEGPPGISWPQLISRLHARGIGNTPSAQIQNLLWSRCIQHDQVVLRSPDGRPLPKSQAPPEPPQSENGRVSVVGEPPKKARRIRSKSSPRACESRSASAPGSEWLFDVTDKLRVHLLHLSPYPDLCQKPVGMRALQVIVKTRHEGCWAPFLGLDIDLRARDLFYVVEAFRLAGIIIVVPAIMPPKVMERYIARGGPPLSQGVHSNIYYHVRFFDMDRIEAAQAKALTENASLPLRQAIIEALHNSSAQAVHECDLRRLANKIVDEHRPFEVSPRIVTGLYQKVRQDLVDEQVVECVTCWDRVSKAYRDVLCIHGAHPADVAEPDAMLAIEDGTDAAADATTCSVEVSQGPCAADSEPLQDIAMAAMADVEEADPADRTECGTSYFAGEDCAPHETSSLRIRERSVQLQALDLIRCSGMPEVAPLKGLTSPEFAALLGLRRKHAERLLGELMAAGLVAKVLESEGKTHVNRLYTTEHAKDIMNSDAAPTAPDIVCKQKSTARPFRFDVTFDRRLKRIATLLQERHAVSLQELLLWSRDDRELAPLEGAQMDRKSGFRIMQQLASKDSRAVLSYDDAAGGRFMYWSPAITEEAAVEKVARSHRERIDQRLRRRTCGTLAITDDTSRPVAMNDAPAAPSGAAEDAADTTSAPQVLDLPTIKARKRTLQDVCIHRPYLNSMREVEAHDQKVLGYYGWQSSIMVRLQLLHASLWDTMSVGWDEGFSASQLLEYMELQVFLQVVGCGVHSKDIEALMLNSPAPKRMRDLQPKDCTLLFGRRRRAAVAVNKLLAQLVELGLVENECQPVQESDTGAVKRVHLRYRLCQHVELKTFTASVKDEPPEIVACFDFADASVREEYWKRLQGLVHVWVHRMSPAVDDDPAMNGSSSGGSHSSDGGGERQEDDAAAPRRRRGRRPRVTLPENCNVPALFSRKQGKLHQFLTPHQRAAIDAFFSAILAETSRQDPLATAEASENGRCSDVLALPQQPTRVMTPRSPEIVTLSQSICVAADRIIKHLKHKLHVHSGDQPGQDARVQFTMLHAVRFRCHLCAGLFYQRNSISDHYARDHGCDLPDDERLFCEAAFYNQKQEEAIAKAAPGDRPRRRRRGRRVCLSSESGYDGDERVHDKSGSSGKLQGEGDRPGDHKGPEPNVEQDPRVQRPMSRMPKARTKRPAHALDDAEEVAQWLHFLVTAERLAAAESNTRLPEHAAGRAGSFATVSEETWQCVSRLSGCNKRYCEWRLKKVLRKSATNQRALAALRARGTGVAKGFTTIGGHETLRAIGRAFGRSLLFTPYRDKEPWWSLDFVSHHVHELIECGFQYWQTQGTVCRYKGIAHADRLPVGSKPRFVLTRHARLLLFGRASAFAGFLASSIAVSGPESRRDVTELTHKDIPGEVAMSFLELIAHEQGDLIPRWEDADFYEKGVAPNVQPETPAREIAFPGGTSSEDEKEGGPKDWEDMEQVRGEAQSGDDTIRSTCAKIVPRAKSYADGGVRNHLRQTKSPALQGTAYVPLPTSRKDQQLVTRVEERVRRWVQGCVEDIPLCLQGAPGIEPVDPLLIESGRRRARTGSCDSDLHSETVAEDSRAVHHSTNEDATNSRENASRRVGFEEYLHHADLGTGADDEDALLSLAALLLRHVHGHKARSRPGEGRGVASKPRSLPCATISSLWDVTCKVCSDARQEADADGIGRANPIMRSRFNAAISLLEDLRLIVPFPCGDVFVEMAATTAALYCLRVQDGAVTEQEDNVDSEFAWEFFFKHAQPVGRHWTSNLSPTAKCKVPTRQRAAFYVASAAGLDIEKATSNALILSSRLMAPAPWVQATGRLNPTALRFLCAGMLLQVSRYPGFSAKEVADKVGFFDACEVALLLDGLRRATLLHVPQKTNHQAGSGGSQLFQKRGLVASTFEDSQCSQRAYFLGRESSADASMSNFLQAVVVDTASPAAPAVTDAVVPVRAAVDAQSGCGDSVAARESSYKRLRRR